MRFFKKYPRKGDSITMNGFAQGLRKIALALERMEIQDGHVEWHRGIPRLVIDCGEGGGGVPLTGDCWLLGKKFTYDKDTDMPFLVGYADGSGVALKNVMPDDMPANTYVRKLANEQGDIYMGC